MSKNKERIRIYNATYRAAHIEAVREADVARMRALRTVPEYRKKEEEYRKALQGIPEYREKERTRQRMSKALLQTIPEWREKTNAARRARWALKKLGLIGYEKKKD